MGLRAKDFESPSPSRWQPLQPVTAPPGRCAINPGNEDSKTPSSGGHHHIHAQPPSGPGPMSIRSLHRAASGDAASLQQAVADQERTAIAGSMTTPQGRPVICNVAKNHPSGLEQWLKSCPVWRSTTAPRCTASPVHSTRMNDGALLQPLITTAISSSGEQAWNTSGRMRFGAMDLGVPSPSRRHLNQPVTPPTDCCAIDRAPWI